MVRPILSHFQAKTLLAARQEGAEQVGISLDLGLSTVQVRLDRRGVILPDGEVLTWAEIERVAEIETACFVIADGGLQRAERFSEIWGRYYALMPTSGAPTLLISGIPMHRVQGITPERDARLKVRALGAIYGRALDVCTGLGYTAIALARHADQVITIEQDPIVLELARLNPWSQALFTSSRIEQRIGDATEILSELESDSIQRILHDPPMLSLGGELYALSFYRQLYRVLSPRGRLFHYIGNPSSRSGRNITRGVVDRLQRAGFHVLRRPKAFGVLALKR